jgi:hypothetical protein
MLKQIYKLIGLAMIGGALCFTSQAARPVSNTEFDFEFIKNSNPWLTSENAAGLNSLCIDKASVAEAYYKKDDGQFVDFYESNNSYTYGLYTESFYRLSKSVVFYGKIDYSDFTGKNMGGSVFYNPYYNPTNIVEYADSTAGGKQCESYHLVGALSVDLSKKLSGGLKIDYNTISYFKTKDLRHANDILDMSVTAGLSYKAGKVITAGLNYFYRRSVESITFSSAGNTDQQFYSLIDFGAFYGKQERFGEEGYTASRDTKHYFNEFHGLSLQVELFPKAKFMFFNELGLQLRNGYYGKRSMLSYIYSEHNSDIINYKGVLSYKKRSALHQAEINFGYEKLANYKNDYKEYTPSGGSTTVIRTSHNQALSQTNTQLSVAYTAYLGLVDNRSRWEITAVANGANRDQKTILYPFYRKQQITTFDASLGLKYNVMKAADTYSVYCNTGYGTGSGVVKEDGRYSSNSNEAFESLDRYLYREYEYFTASRINETLGFRYARSVEERKLRLYGDVSYRYTKAFETSYIGDSFGTLTIKLGCNF